MIHELEERLFPSFATYKFCMDFLSISVLSFITKFVLFRLMILHKFVKKLEIMYYSVSNKD